LAALYEPLDARAMIGGALDDVTRSDDTSIEIDKKTYLVRVFVDVDRRPAEVVTVYRTSKMEKYWRREA
jgi:hypothetical protein